LIWPRPSRWNRHLQIQRLGRKRQATPADLHRRMLIGLLIGSEYFTPEEVRRIVRAARIGAKGSLNAINMLEEDMRHFESVFSKAVEGELREQCHNTVLEYGESMRVWEEMKDTGNLCTSDTDPEEEDELTGDDLLQTLVKTVVAASPAETLKAESNGIDWPKRVLR
jgi:hypothetical protein